MAPSAAGSLRRGLGAATFSSPAARSRAVRCGAVRCVTRITLREFRDGASRVLDGVERTGEPVVTTKYERPVGRGLWSRSDGSERVLGLLSDLYRIARPRCATGPGFD